MSTELQHGHSMSHWEERGARGAAISGQLARLAPRQECPTCHRMFRNLKRHLSVPCPGPQAPLPHQNSCPKCGAPKIEWVPTCSTCTGDGARVEQAIAKGRGISVEKTRELCRTGCKHPEMTGPVVRQGRLYLVCGECGTEFACGLEAKR